MYIDAKVLDYVKEINGVEIKGQYPYNVQFEYVSDGLNDLMAMSDVFISRAGANAICELLALRLPNLLIPLPASVSRGDQILNAESFEKQGFSYVIKEEDVTDEKLLAAIHEVFQNRQQYIDAMNASTQMDPITTITELIDSFAK